jgi:DNA ligase (NAD+)
VIERVEAGADRPSEPFSLPETCPVCGTEVVREGAYVICPNGLSCTAQLVGRLEHYASRDALDIETLGEKNARQLVDRGLVTTLADIYDLTAEDLRQLEGFAEKSATKLFDEIQRTKKPRLDRFLYALGIRHVGEHVAQVLATRFRTIEELRNAELDDLRAVHEIGDEIAETVYDFFRRAENVENLDRILAAGVRPEEVPAGSDGESLPLQDVTIVFTGDLHGYTRSEAKEKVEALGARATSSVSGKTDYLVVGENPGSKLDEARERDVEILYEEGFRKLIGEE